VVEVSGTNQYRVKPWALVSTVTPPIVVVFSAVPPEAGALEGVVAAGAAALAGLVELVELVELPHAAIIKAAAAIPAGASHLLFIRIPNRAGVRSLHRITWAPGRSFTCLPRSSAHAGPGSPAARPGRSLAA
jgi:hypothetical protein